jgi:hypothetical protein
MVDLRGKKPIGMWEKLAKVVYALPEDTIPQEFRDEFIIIVGNKVASYRNQKYPRRYKCQPLPIDIIRYKCMNMETYDSLLKMPENKMSEILVDIYYTMKRSWFGLAD